MIVDTENMLSVGKLQKELTRKLRDVSETLEISETVKKRLKGYDRSKNVPWKKIKKKHAV